MHPPQSGNFAFVRGVQTEVLEVRNLVKRYNRIPAVDQVSFVIRAGEILGYLGPNGSGKSTTVKLLTGLIDPTEGEILLDGRNVREDFVSFQRQMGYVPEESHLYPHLTGREYLQLLGRLRGLRRRVLEPRMDELLRLFSLWEDRHSPLSSYSKGMRQKILISGALIHNPRVLIFDEPFSGLDVTTAMVLHTLLREMALRQRIVFYGSHVLEVVEKVCSSVLILRKGKVVAHDAVERLRDLMQQPSLANIFAQLTQQEDPAETVRGILAAIES
jgi:ABC-2 type transport system ATP-binding protein